MKSGIAAAAVAALIIGSSLLALAQRPNPFPPELAGFDMTVARTSKGISLTCEKGCAWKTLQFTLATRPTAVNELGMVSEKGNPTRTGNFLIRFNTDKDGFALSCERGCAWRTLGWAFRPEGTAVPINEYGLVNKK